MAACAATLDCPGKPDNDGVGVSRWFKNWILVWGYRNFPSENAAAVVASALIAFSLRESRNGNDGGRASRWK